MSERCDILVVGGGPAGATAGALLAMRGMDVVVCEGKVFPREKVCGEFMGTGIRAVLGRLGLLARFDGMAGPAVRFVAACSPGNGAAIVGAMPVDGAGAFPRSLSRGDLDEMLLERARECGARILQPCHVVSVEGNLAEGFVAESSRGRIGGRIVVLAHGLAQRGDLSAGGEAPKLRRAYLNFKGHFANCDLPEGAIAIAGAAGIYAGLTRTNRGRCSLAFVVRRDGIARYGNSAEVHLGRLTGENPAFARMLKGAERVGGWMASGPLEPGVRRLYADGRFFVGNAAGEVHALVGEGITLAMRGAEILADTLGGMGRAEEAGAVYERIWRGEFVGRYRAAQVFANLMMRPGLSGMAGMVLEAYPELLGACIRGSGK